MAKAGCATFEEFRSLSPEKLFSAWEEAKKEVKGMGAMPCLDGRFVVGSGVELLAAGKQKQIPYMCGSNSEDVMPPHDLYCHKKRACLSEHEKWRKVP